MRGVSEGRMLYVRQRGWLSGRRARLPIADAPGVRRSAARGTSERRGRAHRAMAGRASGQLARACREHRTRAPRRRDARKHWRRGFHCNSRAASGPLAHRSLQPPCLRRQTAPTPLEGRLYAPGYCSEAAGREWWHCLPGSRKGRGPQRSPAGARERDRPRPREAH